MSNAVPIATNSIEDVCAQYGFGYRQEQGNHFATVDGKEVLVKFGPDGKLPRGRHAFMSAARKASAQFAADYPSKVKPSRKLVGGADADSADAAASVPGKRLLKKLSLSQLAQVKQALDEVIVAKEREEANREEIALVQDKIADLQKAVAILRQYDADAQSPLNELNEARARLRELKS